MLKLKRMVPVGVVVAGGVAASIAFASPPSGQTVSPPVVGTLERTDTIRTRGIQFGTVRGRAEVATYTVTFAPGGHSGWHKHPGILIATVQSGTVVRTVGCKSRVYRAGEVFIEHAKEPPAEVRNASQTEPAVVSATQIYTPGLPRREETPVRTC